jgi:hypothetical protein
MGQAEILEAQKNPNYLAANDIRPFFDYSLGVADLDLIKKSSADAFGFAFNLSNYAFPCPDNPVRELPETQGAYSEYSKKNLDYTVYGASLYANWLLACYDHIKRGERVGIPYLDNTPRKMGFQLGQPKEYPELKPNLPPLRLRHWENVFIEGRNWYIGTYAMMFHIRQLLGFNASYDVCNNFFDAVIRNTRNTNDFAKTDSGPIVEFMQKIDVFITTFGEKDNPHPDIPWSTTYNSDQSPYCVAPLLLKYKDENIVQQIYFGVWGKKAKMQCAFPTLWYPYKDSIYGDGKQTDPEFAIFGFPRLHEDFVRGTVQCFTLLTSQVTHPGDQLIIDTWKMREEFPDYFPSFDFNDKGKIKAIHDWMVSNSRWTNMRAFILNTFPDLLNFYYIEWSQFEASHHLPYLDVMGILIYRHVAKWMLPPNQGDSVNLVKWKGYIPKNTPTKEEVILKGLKDFFAPYEEKPDTETIGTLTPKGHENIHNNLTPIEVDPYFEFPDLKFKFLRPSVFQSQQMYELRDEWMKSYNALWGSGEEWTQHSIFKNIGTLPARPKDMKDLSDQDYMRFVIQFMQNNPLQKPIIPSTLKAAWAALKNIFNDKQVETGWSTSCRKQWLLYMIWVEANVNAIGKEGYKAPGELISWERDGISGVKNVCPDIGICAPFANHEEAQNFGHMLTFGLTFVMGDEWWKDILDMLKDTFDVIIDILRRIAKFIGDHLPEIGLSLGIIAAVALGGYFVFQVVGAEGRKLGS